MAADAKNIMKTKKGLTWPAFIEALMIQVAGNTKLLGKKFRMGPGARAQGIIPSKPPGFRIAWDPY